MRCTLLLLTLTLSFSGSVWGQYRKGYLPKPALTPGATIDVSHEVLCKPGYKSPARNIPVLLKERVLARYGISSTVVGFNIDHLVPVELGGTNSITNLWPQPLSGEWNYHRKNRLEDRLAKMVCRGALDLKTAQREISTDWVAAYRKYMGVTRLLSRHAERPLSSSGEEGMQPWRFIVWAGETGGAQFLGAMILGTDTVSCVTTFLGDGSS